MKKIILALGVLFALSGTVTNQAFAQAPVAEDAAASTLQIGQSFPSGDIDLYDAVSGNDINIQTLQKNNGLLVIFSCNTCPFVIKAQQRTREMLELAEGTDIGVLIFNSNEAQRDGVDSKEAMTGYVGEHNYPNYVVDGDSQYADLFGAKKTPEVFLFDHSGKLVYKGAMDDNPANPSEATTYYLQDAIKAMLSGVEISPKETKSVGCSIKRVK